MATAADAVAAQDEVTPVGRLTLVGLSGRLGPGFDDPVDVDDPEEDAEEVTYDVDVRIGVVPVTDVDEPRVTVALHPSTGVRDSLHAALDDGVLDTRALATAEQRLDEPLRAGTQVGLALQLPDADVPWPDEPGVFPVAIGLFDGSTQLDQLVTAVVWLPAPALPTLQTVTVLPLTGATTRSVRGNPSADPLPVTDRGSPLRVLLQALRTHPDLVVTPSPSVTLVEELADRADGWTTDDDRVFPSGDPLAVAAATTLDEIRAVVAEADGDPVVGAYADADIAALAAATLTPEVAALASEAVSTSRNRLQQLLGRAPDLATHLATTTVTPAVVDLLRDQRVVLPWTQTTGATDTSLVQLGGGAGVAATGLRTDPHVDEILASTTLSDGAVERVQRLRAELALLWLQAPAVTRVVTLLPPRDWNPSLRVLSGWLDVLEDDPWLVPSTPRDVAASGRTGPVAALVTATATMSAEIQAQTARVLQLLAALEAATGDQEVGPTVAAIPTMRDAVLRATGFATSDPDRAAAILQEVTGLVTQRFGEVVVTAPDTLLDDAGELPVTLQRRRGGPINVVVVVESAGRLVWEGEGQMRAVALPADSSRTVTFAARAVSRGTFPVTVTVLDPTQTRVLSTTDLSVRSQSINLVVLTVIALLVLGLLWFGRRRRGDAARPLALVDG